MFPIRKINISDIDYDACRRVMFTAIQAERLSPFTSCRIMLNLNFR